MDGYEELNGGATDGRSEFQKYEKLLHGRSYWFFFPIQLR
jgi:hypothetical protein